MKWPQLPAAHLDPRKLVEKHLVQSLGVGSLLLSLQNEDKPQSASDSQQRKIYHCPTVPPTSGVEQIQAAAQSLSNSSADLHLCLV